MNVTRDRNSTAALLLIAIGVIALLGTLGVFRFVADLIGALMFGGLAYFAYSEGKRRGNSAWRLASVPLAGLAIAVIAPFGLGGGAFLASLGLAFALYWHEDRHRWWALIPAGVLGSLGLMESFDGLFGGSPGWLFLVGMALTFFALTRLEVEPQPWAVWPAAGIGLIALLSFVDGGGWVVPLLLIGAGALMLFRQDGLFGVSVKVERRGPREPVGQAAARPPTVDVEPAPPVPQPPRPDDAQGPGPA